MSDSPLAGTPRERLVKCSNLSAGESAVALWLEQNYEQLPFESAARVAKGSGVSEMTVVRFVRRLDYANFRDFKRAVNDSLRPVEASGHADRDRRFTIGAGSEDELAPRMQKEIEALMAVYDLARTPIWSAALDVLMAAERINVTGFQASRGLALDFASRLKYARPGVRFAEGTSGNWSELFADNAASSCVVLVDTAAYARTSFQIAEQCLRQSIPLIIVTDTYSHWPRKFTSHALAVHTQIGTFWDTNSGLSCLLGLLVDGVAARIGAPARERLARMQQLGEHFEAYAYEPDATARPLPEHVSDQNRKE